MKILKDLYDWVLSWSNSKWGPVALLLMAIAEASFFPIPPDVLLIGLALGNRKKAFYYSSHLKHKRNIFQKFLNLVLYQL